PARAQGEPAVTVLAVAERHGHGTLGTEDERASPVQRRSEPQKVMGAGAPTMEGDDRRERTVPGWDVGCVQQTHSGRRISRATPPYVQGSVAVAKEGLKSGLDEVAIVGESLGNAVADHDPEGRAVRMTPALVAPISV